MEIIIQKALDSIPTDKKSISFVPDFEHQLLNSLNYSKEQPPIADLLSKYHNLTGRWAVASPVYWQASHNDALILATGNDLDYTDEESRFLFSHYQEFMVAEGMELYYHDKNTWLIRYDDKPEFIAKPPYILLSHSLFPELQKLDSTLFWQKIITESQMFIENYKKNLSGNITPNGLWFWGNGFLKQKVGTAIFTNNSSYKKLASILSTNTHEYDLTNITKNSILLFENLSFIEAIQLAQKFNNFETNFYWNNFAFTIPATSWFSRFIGKWKHAN